MSLIDAAGDVLDKLPGPNPLGLVDDVAGIPGDVAERVLAGAAGIIAGPVAELVLASLITGGGIILLYLGLRTVLLRTPEGQLAAGVATKGAGAASKGT